MEAESDRGSRRISQRDIPVTKPRGWGLKPVVQRHFDALTQIGFAHFEKLLADHYRGQGYVVEHCGTGRAGSRFDGGVDLKLRRESEFILVQCKHWNANQVTHNAVHELLGIMVNQGATGAIVVTSGEFTAAAKEAAGRLGHVQLIDGVEVRRMLGDRLSQLIPPAPPLRPSPASSNSLDELVVAIDSRRRTSSRRRGSDKNSAEAILIKIIAGVVFFIVAIVVAPRLIMSAVKSIVPTQSSAPVAPVPPPADPSPEAPAPLESGSPQYQMRPELTVPPPSAREIAAAKIEQARRDEETRRALERIPEVTHYRYSPLEQNRDPPTEPSN